MYLAILTLGEAMQPFGQILYQRPYYLLYNASERRHHIRKHDAFPMYEFGFLQVAPSYR